MSDRSRSATKQSILSPRDAEKPHPPRYWWLKRLGSVFLILVLAVLGGRLWLGYVASSALQVEIDAIKAAGEPLYREDFRIEPFPDEENAAHYYREALAAWPKVSDGEVSDYIPLFETVPSVDNTFYLKDCERSISLVRTANGRERCHWQVKRVSLSTQFEMPHLSELRLLMRCLLDAAERYHELGNDVETIRLLNDVLDLSDRTNEPPLILCYLVELSIRAAVAFELQKYSSEWLTSAVDNPADPGQSELRGQIEALIDRLIEESEDTESFRSAIMGERGLSSFAFYNGIVTGEIPISDAPNGDPLHIRVSKWWSTPRFKREALMSLRAHRTWIDSSDQPSWPAFQDLSTQNYDWRKAEEQFAQSIMGSFLLPALDATFETHYSNRAQLRLAAVGLAVRLYEIDHGQLPDALDQLVPDYLREIPKDPLAMDGKSIRFIRNGPAPSFLVGQKKVLPDGRVISMGMFNVITDDRKRPAIYSVGLDGVDDGGLFFLDEDGDINWHGAEDQADIPFFLDGPIEAFKQEPEE